MVQLEKTTYVTSSRGFALALEIFALGTALALSVVAILAAYIISILLVLNHLGVLTYEIVSFFLLSALTSNLISKVVVGFIKHLL